MTEVFNKRSEIIKRKLLRRSTPAPENLLWWYLKNRKVNNLKFKRQFSIGKYVVDFYCAKLRLVIEVDGSYHNRRFVKEYDIERQKTFESLGIKVLRFSNKEIEESIEGVVDKISSVSLSLRRRGREAGEVL